MKYLELHRLIFESDKKDWLFNDERGIYTYKDDLNIRIERQLQDDKFTGEDWATNHPDPNAYRVIFEIYYGSSFVEERLLVFVDGFRAALPLPDIATKEVSKEGYCFAAIVDQLDTLDEYLNSSGLKVRDA